MIWGLAVALVLYPVMDEDGSLRVVATGLADESANWYLDGHLVATTTDRQAAKIWASAGVHELVATAGPDQWLAMARHDPPVATGALYVDSWTARAPDDAVSSILDMPDPGAPGTGDNSFSPSTEGYDANAGLMGHIKKWVLPAGLVAFAAVLGLRRPKQP